MLFVVCGMYLSSTNIHKLPMPRTMQKTPIMTIPILVMLCLCKAQAFLSHIRGLIVTGNKPTYHTRSHTRFHHDDFNH